MHTGLAQRIPERYLVAGEHRPIQLFLERRYYANRPESVPANEDTFGADRNLRARERVKLRGIQLGKLAQRIARLRYRQTPKAHLICINDIESLVAKVANAQPVVVVREPWRMKQCNAPHPQRTKTGHCCGAGK